MQFSLCAIVLGGGLLVLANNLDPTPTLFPELLALAVFLAVTAISLRAMARAYPHSRLGLCNMVTQARGALACVLVIPVVSAQAMVLYPWIFFGMAIATLSLDGLDGWLARRSGLSSGFGARFDMETDTCFAAILSLVVLQSGKTGALVLILGFARYAFMLASLRWSWLLAPLAASTRRKLICVVQIASLSALLAPPVHGFSASTITLGASLLLVYSFVTDILWLARKRT